MDKRMYVTGQFVAKGDCRPGVLRGEHFNICKKDGDLSDLIVGFAKMATDFAWNSETVMTGDEIHGYLVKAAAIIDRMAMSVRTETEKQNKLNLVAAENLVRGGYYFYRDTRFKNGWQPCQYEILYGIGYLITTGWHLRIALNETTIPNLEFINMEIPQVG